MSEPRKVKRTNFLKKGFNAVMTFADWKAAGYPVRDPEDVKAIFETHCAGFYKDHNDNWTGHPATPCPLYVADGQAVPLGPRGLCDDGLEFDGVKGCGCHVSPDAGELTNALAVPVHPCPRGLFGHEQLDELEFKE